MRILRLRRGFQADHSSSSYLFYAADRPVSAKGRAVAHRYSSRAEVEERTVRYHKWGESSLSSQAYEALLGEHYDIMVSESYDWWSLKIALPRTPEMERLLAPFRDARGYNDQGVDVEEYGKRLVVDVFCSFEGNGVEFGGYDDDPLEVLAELLVEVRAELMAGDTSFLEAVVAFYDGGGDEDEDEDELDDEGRPMPPPATGLDVLSKAELQERCKAAGIAFAKSWTKDRLRNALEAKTSSAPARGARSRGRAPRLSRAARTIVDQLERV